MANRERKNELKIYLSDEEKYILEQKVKVSGMRDKPSFLRRQILYGFIYNIDYSELQEYNTALGRIGNNLNQIAKRMNAIGNQHFYPYVGCSRYYNIRVQRSHCKFQPVQQIKEPAIFC